MGFDRKGVTQFFYGQVDNPLVPWCDPEMIGYHMMAHSQMTTVVVRKRFAEEKVGNVVEVDGRMCIIEYSDLPSSAANKVTDSGEIYLWAGNIAVHLFDLAFLEAVSVHADGFRFIRPKSQFPISISRGM